MGSDHRPCLGRQFGGHAGEPLGRHHAARHQGGVLPEPRPGWSARGGQPPRHYSPERAPRRAHQPLQPTPDDFCGRRAHGRIWSAHGLGPDLRTHAPLPLRLHGRTGRPPGEHGHAHPPVVRRHGSAPRPVGYPGDHQLGTDRRLRRAPLAPHLARRLAQHLLRPGHPARGYCPCLAARQPRPRDRKRAGEALHRKGADPQSPPSCATGSSGTGAWGRPSVSWACLRS